MPSLPILKCAGLHTANNELSALPVGALVRAENCIIQAKDVIAPRRGQASVGTTFPGGTGNALEVFFYQDKPFAYLDTHKLVRFDGSFSTSLSSLTPPYSALRPKFAEVGKNLYFTSTKGVYRLDSVSGTPALAGGPKTADLYGAMSPGALHGGFLAPLAKVAYRVVFGYKDANNVIHLGPPSGRSYITNTNTGPTDSLSVNVRIPVPSWVTTSMFYRVYRSEQVDTNPTEANPFPEPSDEMGLVVEKYFTSADLAAGFIQVTDNTPDDLRGDDLYTNANSSEGLGQSNDPPPLCLDLAYWGGRMWYGNTTQFHRLSISLLGVGVGQNSATATADSLTGVRVGDKITIGGMTFVCGAANDASGAGSYAPNYAFGQGNVTTPAGDPDPGASTALTARNLVEVINRAAGNTTIRAYYDSGTDDVPGRIVIENRALDGTSFSATVGTYQFSITNLAKDAGGIVTATTSLPHGLSTNDVVTVTATSPNGSFPVGNKTVTGAPTSTTFTYTDGIVGATSTAAGAYKELRLYPPATPAWTPNMAVGAQAVTSDNEARPARLYYSKIGQPEAVPALNYLDVGAAGRQILRIVPLRDKLFVFKEDGVFVVSGVYPYSVDLLDPNVRLMAPDTAVAGSDQIFALTNLGLCAISDGGVQVLSDPIANEVQQMLGPAQITFVLSYAFGCIHPSDGLYSLWLPPADMSVAYATRAFVFNFLHGGWTSWILNRYCGRVLRTYDQLYMGPTSGNTLVQERKIYTNFDYCDELYTESATYSSGTGKLTFSSLANVSVGDAVLGPSNSTAVITAIDTPTKQATLAAVTGTFSPSLTSVTVCKAFRCKVQYAVLHAGAVRFLKHWTECDVHFRKKRMYGFKVYFSNELDSTASEVDLTDSTYHAPATNAQEYWGTFVDPIHKRLLIPQDKRRSTYLHTLVETNEALSQWALNGIEVGYEVTSERTQK
jgi:hypothetical protein